MIMEKEDKCPDCESLNVSDCEKDFCLKCNQCGLVYGLI
jgi:hypothetical protein